MLPYSLIVTSEQIKADLDTLGLDDETRNSLQQFCVSWLKCSKQKIIIENFKENIVVIKNDKLYVGKEVLYDVGSNNTIYFEKCENINIRIEQKINHLTTYGAKI